MTECEKYLALLRSDDNEIVRDGAFKAGEHNCVEAVELLAELLQTNHLGIQEAADSSLRKIGGKATVRAVLPYLRSDEAPVRNLAMDILREVGSQDLPSLISLIHDEDADIRIFAADIWVPPTTCSPSSLCVTRCSATPRSTSAIRPPSAWASWQARGLPCLNKAINDEEWVQYSVIEA